jgi:hypothetical protein
MLVNGILTEPVIDHAVVGILMILRRDISKAKSYLHLTVSFPLKSSCVQLDCVSSHHLLERLFKTSRLEIRIQLSRI